jgi:hypothetical protein
MAAALPSGLRLASSVAARMVKSILMPVSPSGTGKTLSALIDGALRSSQRVAALNMLLRSRPLQRTLLLTTGLLLISRLSSFYLLSRLDCVIFSHEFYKKILA